MGIQNTMRALSDPIRREILNLLKKGRMAAGDIADHFEVTGASISRHLSVLKDAGCVKHLICGHEHMNDYSVLWDGIRLTYTMKVGQASGYQPGFDGGTVFTVGRGGIKRITHKTRKDTQSREFYNIEDKSLR